ncbi:adenylate isopentenyltransferase 3, chloroplastic [Argentina anserina]|uniref:adenylate isopentenyltransferase 3, chloroplastic n=1 Tax=Argentina anserina TaxID=57926 RepID=UPI002176265B|nr:adenylate isopentenyltransferase 3, chloroplastic [Potentilla anserina]
MTMDMMRMCTQTQTLQNVPLSIRGGHSRNILDVFHVRRQKDKVVIIMGATGTGKSKLSIDLATRFPGEVINSDKIQFYEGLDIATNKITPQEQRGVPHHMLGVLDPNVDFSADDFCDVTCRTVESILNRNRLPIIVGGSNSYIEALVDGYDKMFRSRYDFVFLWVDVSLPVLHSFVSDRVDQMVENGMVEEARAFFDPNADYTKGIRRAIGVPEFDDYFQYGPFLDEETRAGLLEQAINAVKDNTCKLACRQLEKIRRLRNKGWSLHQLDATEVFRNNGKESHEAWDRLVSGPSAMIVRQFLYNVKADVPTNLPAIRVPAAMETAALAAATY